MITQGPTPLLDRPALVQALDQGSLKRLTLLTAPAGSGKSTLIRQWLATEPDRPAALMTLQDLDRDPARFFARLAQTIRAKAPDFDSSAFTPFDAGSHCTPSTIAEALVHSLAPIDHPVVLILDDFQHLSHTPVITDTFNRLLDHPPACLHLIIASRARPALKLSQLKLNQDMLELSARDLQFSSTEAKQLCQSLGNAAVATNTLDHLLRITEGWITGLRLALLAAREQGIEALDSFSGNQPEVMAYFGDMVLQALPSSLRSLCLQSALFDRITGSLCDQVLKHTGSSLILEHLARQELFLMPMDHDPGWYRFHPLLRDFLQTRLAMESPALIPALHRRAVHWFLSSGDYHQALKHAQSSDDAVLLGDILETAFGIWSREGHFSRILFWEYRLQNSPLLLRTGVAVPLLCTLILSRRFHQASTMLERFRDAGPRDVSPDHHRVLLRFLQLYLELFQNDNRFIGRQDYQDLVQQSRLYDIFPLSLCMAAYHHLQHARPEQALEYASQALEVLKQSGHHFMMDYASLIIALCHRSLGRPGQAMRDIQGAYLNMPIDGAARILRSTAMVVALYDQNRLAEANTLCRELLPKLNKTSAIEVIATVYLTHARCLFALGDRDKATYILGKLEHILEPEKNRRFISHLIAERIRQCWLNGARERVEQAAVRAGLPTMLQKGDWDTPGTYSEYRERLGLATVYWLRATGRKAQAGRILRLLARELADTGLVSRALVVSANEWLSRDDSSRNSKEALDALIQHYGLHNMTRNLFDEAPGFGKLLAGASDHGLVLPDNYLALYGNLVPESARSAAAVRPDPLTLLTHREQDIYRCLLGGLSNSAISQQTGTTVSTIKWHLKNIYSKLGVRNRTEAVLLAASHDPANTDA
ncbi:hypothetical protein J122_1991 [Marinobacter excellens LAMA 842]|jgi:LuxR family maltose regulon positive regulatory protein|uniref:HTH luxR-type domain-containing protein n=2 Tax=Marinobacteraceae TaxID=2887365 RepID=A0A137SCB8_9GAMM|nr:hypothetical protein J122_1991 [Marinobacter excellens LAMA 842]